MWKAWTHSESHFRGLWLHDTLNFVVQAQTVAVGICYLFSSTLIVELF